MNFVKVYLSNKEKMRKQTLTETLILIKEANKEKKMKEKSQLWVIIVLLWWILVTLLFS